MSGETLSKSTKGIMDIDDLAIILGDEKASGKKIVQCHGVFDLLHIGHIRHFEQAKKQGDLLAVTVTPDRFVNKGPNRPAFPENLRAEAIAALNCVDYVAINCWPSAVESIHLLKPDFYVKGSDYQDPKRDLTSKILDEAEAVTAVGGSIVFTDDIVFSSSNLINEYLPTFSEETRSYLAKFSKKYSVDEVLGYLNSAKSLRVLVVGEAIIDEYQYCEQIGKSSKEPVLAVRYLSTEKFAGGILAPANHTANFCEQVGLLTVLGAQASQEDFIREALNSDIETVFLYNSAAPTIVKRRFVESYLMQKLFEVYEMHDEESIPAENPALCNALEELLPRYDVIIVIDYGHGMLTKDAIDILCSRSKFLAVNSQINAGNQGLNTISKYARADYVSLALSELKMEEQRRDGNLEEMLLNVSRKLDCQRVLVTRGKDGNLGYSKTEGFFYIPAFTNHTVDRMGAGDAVMSLTALCVAQQAPMELVGFIANAVGAQAVTTVGNRQSIEQVPLFKQIESLLK
jgi:rfaE bifunctional protein kinase chain/domain/rfaE bifunctional protein nucleotidyltransferase chain/domain